MKKLFSLLPVIFLSTVLCAQQVNDVNAEVRPAKNYHGISIGNAFDVYLTQSNEEAVAVSAYNAKDRDMIVVEVKNGILNIGLNKGFRWNSGNKKLKAYISFKNIDQLDISGACDAFMQGTLKADNLSIILSGASDFKDAKLDVGKLAIDLSGASDMKVTGKAGQLVIEASGASGFKGYDLVTETCDAKATGASDINITVNKEISAHATGASDVRYKGNGVTKDVKTSGASSVSKS
jgi:hypothetical protein